MKNKPPQMTDEQAARFVVLFDDLLLEAEAFTATDEEMHQYLLDAGYKEERLTTFKKRIKEDFLKRIRESGES